MEGRVTQTGRVTVPEPASLAVLVKVRRFMCEGACVRACMRVSACVRACVRTCARARMCVCVYVCVRVCMCVYDGLTFASNTA